MDDHRDEPLDLERLANEARSTARTPAERATFARVALAARTANASALSPQAEAAYSRAAHAFQEHDAAAAARTAEVQGSLGRSIEALAPSTAPITNASFALVRDRLPDWVQAIFERLDDQLDEVRAKRREWMEDLQAAIYERGQIVAKIKTSTQPHPGYSNLLLLPEDHPTVIKLQAEKAKLDVRIEKLNARMEDTKPQFEHLDRLQERCRAYSRQLLSHSVEFVPHDGKQAKRPAGADLKKAIADIRQEIAELFADLRELQAKPRPSAQVKGKVRQLVEATAKPPRVLGALEYGEDILWPTVGVRGNHHVSRELVGSDLTVPPEAYSVGGVSDALGVLCFAFKDTLITAIDAEVDRYSDDANAITDEQRAQGEADIRAKIILAEREEEQLIRQAEERELPVYRRGDADPRVVLGLASSMPAMPEDVI
ncbi:hypothetical protein [Bradyrhizobium sp. USDA 4502]